MTAIIGYNNVLRESGVTITVSSEATDFPAANAYDWWPYDSWKPSAGGNATFQVDLTSAKNMDYLAIQGHSLGTDQDSVKLETWNGSAWVEQIAAYTPAVDDDRVIFITFTQVTTHTKAKLSFTVASGYLGAIANIAIGERIDLPQGMQPGFPIPGMTFNDKINNQFSVGGLLIGSSLKSKGEKFTIDQPSTMTPAFIRTTMKPFFIHARKKPFFFSWDYVNYPLEATFCKIDGAITPPRHATGSHLSLSINCVALAE